MGVKITSISPLLGIRIAPTQPAPPPPPPRGEKRDATEADLTDAGRGPAGAADLLEEELCSDEIKDLALLDAMRPEVKEGVFRGESLSPGFS